MKYRDVTLQVLTWIQVFHRRCIKPNWDHLFDIISPYHSLRCSYTSQRIYLLNETAIYMSLLLTHTSSGHFDDQRLLWTLTSENDRACSRFLVDRFLSNQGMLWGCSAIPWSNRKASTMASWELKLTEAWKFIIARIRHFYCKEYHDRGRDI